MAPARTAESDLTTGSPGLRKQGRLLRMADAEEVAIRLMSERGFDDVTIDEIANGAQISRRTFFRYFPGGKEETILAFMVRQQEHLVQYMEDRPHEETATAALRAAFLCLAADMENDRDGIVARARIAESSPQLLARSHGELVRNQEALTHLVAARLNASVVQDPRPAIIVATMSATYSASLAHWVMNVDKPSLPDVLRSALDLLDRGLHTITDG